MNAPTVLTTVSTVFILLGGFNMYAAARRAREAKLRGETFKWFRQINALLGIEYLLLAWVFMLTNLFNNATVPSNIKAIALPLYLLILVVAAIFAGLVLRRGILNSRTIRAQARSTISSASSRGTTRIVNAQTSQIAAEQGRSQDLERRRERRKNAAAARRRRAGKA